MKEQLLNENSIREQLQIFYTVIQLIKILKYNINLF